MIQKDNLKKDNSMKRLSVALTLLFALVVLNHPLNCCGNNMISKEGNKPKTLPLHSLPDVTFVAATAGKIASLPCKVKSVGNRTVTWLRHRDLHLLTVGVYTHSTDQRYRASHIAGSESWNLEIRYVQERDAGVYECQMGSTPTVSQYVNLTVIEASSVILGGPELFIDKGSTINLTCLVRHSEPPEHVFWTNNDKRITYDSPRGGVSVLTERTAPYDTVSSLRLLRATERDAGLYKCRPTSGNEASIVVHVLDGEFPAAMQRSNQVPVSIWGLVLGLAFIVFSSRNVWR